MDAIFWAALGFLLVAAVGGAVFVGMRAWRAWVVFTSFAAGGLAGAEALAVRAEQLGTQPSGRPAKPMSSRRSRTAATVAAPRTGAGGRNRGHPRCGSAVLAFGRPVLGARGEAGFVAGEQRPRLAAGIGGRTGIPAHGRSRAPAPMASWPCDSIPSAIATSPSAWARLARLAVIAASLASCSTPWTKERSTLSTSTGNRRRCPSDEKPGAEVVDRDPHAERVEILQLVRARSPAGPSRTTAVSVTSSPSRPARGPARRGSAAPVARARLRRSACRRR